MTLAMCLAFLRYLGRQFYQPGAGALCRTVAPGAGAGAGVGKVAIGGVIPQQINVDISLAKMAARGITLNQLAAILARLNVVSSAGRSALAANRSASTPPVSFRASMSWEICWSALTAPAPPPDCGILLRCRAG